MNKIKKFVVGLTLLGMVVAVPVGATTAEDLLAQIQALQTQLNQLMTQYQTLTGDAPAAGVPATCTGVTFTRNLSQGSDGSDVKCLQALLNTDVATQVAATGVGSSGNETNYFGSLTRAAVVSFQGKYAAEVLTPLGLTAGTGFVGTQTRAKLNAMLTAPAVPTDPADPADPDTPAPVVPSEGDLEVRWLPTPTAVEAGWGATNVAVGAIELKAKDSAITVDRVDINFDAVPWRKINYLSLYDGESAVRGVSIDSTTVTEVALGTDYRLRLTGLNISVPKDGVKNITVKVNVPARPHTPGSMVMTLNANAVRGTDTAGIQQYAPASLVTRSFTVKTAGQGARVETKLSDATPAEGVAVIDQDVTTEHEVLRFDLKVTRDNAELRTLVVSLSDETNIDAVRLYDGTTVLGSQAGSTTVTFSDLRLGMAKDSTKTLSVMVEYAATGTTANLYASIADTSGGTGVVVAVSASGEDTDYTGSATGNTIHFYEVAPEIKLVSASSQTVGDTARVGQASVIFSVTAKGGDIYISSSTSQVYGTTTASSTGVSLIQTTATQVGSGYRVPQGSTINFTVSFSGDNTGGTGGLKEFYIENVRWSTTPALGSPQNWSNTNFAVKHLKAPALYLNQ